MTSLPLSRQQQGRGGEIPNSLTFLWRSSWSCLWDKTLVPGAAVWRRCQPWPPPCQRLSLWDPTRIENQSEWKPTQSWLKVKREEEGTFCEEEGAKVDVGRHHGRARKDRIEGTTGLLLGRHRHSKEKINIWHLVHEHSQKSKWQHQCAAGIWVFVFTIMKNKLACTESSHFYQSWGAVVLPHRHLQQNFMNYNVRHFIYSKIEWGGKENTVIVTADNWRVKRKFVKLTIAISEYDDNKVVAYVALFCRIIRALHYLQNNGQRMSINAKKVASWSRVIERTPFCERRVDTWKIIFMSLNVVKTACVPSWPPVERGENQVNVSSPE